MDESEQALLATIVDEPIIAAERCAMGFENRTDLVTLASGEKRIAQRITNSGMAAHKIRLAHLLPDRFAEVGLCAPRLLRADAHTAPPFLVREYIAGDTGASLMATDNSAIEVAEAMGAALLKLASIQTQGLGLNTVWANPARLAAQAHAQLERRRELISEAHTNKLRPTIEAFEPLFVGRTGVFAHGDYCPINAVLTPDDERRTTNDQRINDSVHRSSFVVRRCLSALIDFEFARVADPLFDPAWWGWVVRYHHVTEWRVAFPHLLASAGIPNDAITRERIQAIQRVRLLEALDYNAALSPERGIAWAKRLATTLEWTD